MKSVKLPIKVQAIINRKALRAVQIIVDQLPATHFTHEKCVAGTHFLNE